MKAIFVLILSGSLFTAPLMADEGAGGKRLFKLLDKDKNGAVSSKEYVAAAKRRAQRNFKRMDSNADGQISKQEFKAAGDKLKKFLEERD